MGGSCINCNEILPDQPGAACPNCGALATPGRGQESPHALAPCNDCGHRVSLRAASCPSCGAPGPSHQGQDGASVRPARTLDNPTLPSGLIEDDVAQERRICTACGQLERKAVDDDAPCGSCGKVFFQTPARFHELYPNRTIARGPATGRPSANTAAMYGQSEKKRSIWPWVLGGLALLVLLVTLFGDSGSALCTEDEDYRRIDSCNNFDKPCPSNVSGCGDGCVKYACVDQSGQITRTGWVSE